MLENATGAAGASKWTQLATTGGLPPQRIYESLVYDASTNRAILHAGCTVNCSPARSDTWVLTHADGTGGPPEWLQLPSAPVARAGQVAGYDPGSNRMVIFGGHAAFPGTNRNDVWVLKDANGIGTPEWEQLIPAGPIPPPRGESNSGAYDPASNQLFIMGGCAAGTGVPAYNDVWVLDHANGRGGTPAWTQLQPTSSRPSPRCFHNVAYDDNRNELIVFGGSNGTDSSAPTNDVWTLSNADGRGGPPAWTKLNPPCPNPRARFGARAAYADKTNQLIVALGRNDAVAGSLLDDTWVLSLGSAAPAPPGVPVVCDSPVAIDDAASTDEDTPLAIPETDLLANDSDPEGDELSVTDVTATADTHGSVRLTDGTITYEPARDYHSQAGFDYVISDAAGHTATATVTVTIRPVQDPPQATDDTASTDEDVPVTITTADLLANDSDPDGDRLSFEDVASTPDTHGTVSVADGKVTYTPNPDYHGPAIFTYTISDGHDTDTANVAITVESIDDPSLSARDVRVPEGDVGTTDAVVAVSLTSPSPRVATVQYATQDGSAEAGTDYTATTGTLTIPAGATDAVVSIPVRGDSADESDETFIVVFSGPVQLEIADGESEVTVIDDDEPAPAPGGIMKGSGIVLDTADSHQHGWKAKHASNQYRARLDCSATGGRQRFTGRIEEPQRWWWWRPQHRRYTVNEVTEARCSDDPAIPTPRAGFDTIEGAGTGVYGGKAATFEWELTDGGHGRHRRHAQHSRCRSGDSTTLSIRTVTESITVTGCVRGRGNRARSR